MGNFIEAGTLTDGSKIYLETGWEPAKEYYLLSDDERYRNKSSIELDGDANTCLSEFISIDGAHRLVFKHLKSGLITIVDPMDENVRNNILIYAVNKKNVTCEHAKGSRVKWFNITEMIFDTKFFNVGHSYKIRSSPCAKEHICALLTELSANYMTFVYTEPDGNLKKYVVTHKMYKALHHDNDEWFVALLPEDKWSYEKETNESTEPEKEETNVFDTERFYIYDVNNKLNNESNVNTYPLFTIRECDNQLIINYDIMRKLMDIKNAKFEIHCGFGDHTQVYGEFKAKELMVHVSTTELSACKKDTRGNEKVNIDIRACDAHLLKFVRVKVS